MAKRKNYGTMRWGVATSRQLTKSNICKQGVIVQTSENYSLNQKG